MKDPRQVIERALLTEKGAAQRETANQYVFKVAMDANKIEIKQSVEEIYGVSVKHVTTAVRRGKSKRFGRYYGKRANWKRAVVTLAQGETIDNLFESA
jgi:large subunit ribosomal protein L23